MKTKVFILGAPDPEMEEIERVIRENGHEVRYALLRQTRVRAEQAYLADSLDAPIPKDVTLVFVECSVLGLTADALIDHHREGDPGFGKPPETYLESSSLGQTLSYLGVIATDEQRVIAAADHCPTQAYQGKCPGVTPEALRQWRTASRAARRGVTPEEMDASILFAKSVLENAERIDVGGCSLPWVSDRKGEITEASARYNLPFLYAERLNDGRTKMGIMGAIPKVIETWMRECGLTNVYGDPARGYAGGYFLS
jgi:hypothetical protein